MCVRPYICVQVKDVILHKAVDLCIHANKMSFKLPSLPKARTKDLYERITAGLETFSWSELSDISEIDRGTFGSVLLASFSNATSVGTNRLFLVLQLLLLGQLRTRTVKSIII